LQGESGNQSLSKSKKFEVGVRSRASLSPAGKGDLCFEDERQLTIVPENKQSRKGISLMPPTVSHPNSATLRRVRPAASF
jgi:hypothetical protein